jgi:hypothetical protein
MLRQPAPAQSAGDPALGYKRMILDYHFSEFSPEILRSYSAAEIVKAIVDLGAQSLLLYAKDHWGHCYFETKRFRRHPAVPTDLFGDVLQGLHEHGVGINAYYSVAWDELSARQHPDWVLRDANGVPARLNYPLPNYAHWTFLCTNTAYGQYSLDELDELMGRYRFEALFLDIFGSLPACYCDACRKLWRTSTGEELPRKLAGIDLARYIDFQTKEIFGAYYDRVLALLKRHNLNIPSTHNAGLEYSRDGYVASEIDPYGADFFRSGLEAKIWRARAAGKDVELICHRTNGMFDFTLKPTAELTWEVATAAAHRAAVMFVDQPFASGRIDHPAYREIRKAFAAADDLHPFLTECSTLAEILIVTSERSEQLNPADSTLFRPGGERADLSGAYKMFAELHYPFDIVTAEQLLNINLAATKVIVFPYVRCVDPALVVKMREWVAAGGTLLFTYRTAEWDTQTRPLEHKYFGLIRLGADNPDQVTFVHPSATFGLADSYLRVRETALLEHDDALTALGTLTHPALRVTEQEWVTHNVIPGEDTSLPVLVAGWSGKGLFIYSGFRYFKEGREQGLGAYRRLLDQELRRRYEPGLFVEAPGLIDSIYYNGPGDIRAVLLNAGSDRPAGEGDHINIEEFIPVAATVCSRRTVAAAFDLSGKPLPVSRSDGFSRVKVSVAGAYAGVRLVMTI